MQDDLLLAEMVARMNDEMRMILEGLLLGYTFEEMPKSMAKAQTTGGPSSNRGVKRLAREVRDAERPGDG
jgi:hypothetical protein